MLQMVNSKLQAGTLYVKFSKCHLICVCFVRYVLFWQTVFRPDITVMVDWALKINYLSIYPSNVFSVCRFVSTIFCCMRWINDQFYRFLCCCKPVQCVCRCVCMSCVCERERERERERSNCYFKFLYTCTIVGTVIAWNSCFTVLMSVLNFLVEKKCFGYLFLHIFLSSSWHLMHFLTWKPERWHFPRHCLIFTGSCGPYETQEDTKLQIILWTTWNFSMKF